MNDRPLFPPAPPSPRPKAKRPGSALPPLPARPKPLAETWRIDIVTLPGDTVPPIVRIKKLLKMALRAYRLRAVAIESLPAIATPGNLTGNESSEPLAMPQTAFNAAAPSAKRGENTLSRNSGEPTAFNVGNIEPG